MTSKFFLLLLIQGVVSNQPPIFTADMNNHVILENTPFGQNVFQLQGSDPEGSPVMFGLKGTDKLVVDKKTGVVTVAKNIDREVESTIRFVVTLEDEVGGGRLENNVVSVPISVIILDENDNFPVFQQESYDTIVPETATIGTVILNNIVVSDSDLVGEILDIFCSSSLLQVVDDCDNFEIYTEDSTPQIYSGKLLLSQPLAYSEQQNYHINLTATDGEHNTTIPVVINVGDVQNTPPVFYGSLIGVVNETDPIGTLVLQVKALDGDQGNPRKVIYELVTNPNDYFLLDPETGALRTAKPLDREALAGTSGMINVSVRARELVNGTPGDDPLTVSTADATITIRDVNDEPPRFNQKEYTVEIPENTSDGTVLPSLNIFVEDTDAGTNSAFNLRLDDISGIFSLEPKTAIGRTRVNIQVSHGPLDFENPSQRKFILLVIAEETHTNPQLSSSATVTVVVTDTNDNAPLFSEEEYTASLSEASSSGTLITAIVARDRDAGNYGERSLKYDVSGNGSESFSVNPTTGVITVSECNTPGMGNCLDYERQPTYLLSYSASDNGGYGHKTNVPLKISLIDNNDNPPEFSEKVYQAVIDEGVTQFQPPLIVQAKDADNSSSITYSIVGGNQHNYIEMNSVSGEIRINVTNGLNATTITSGVFVLTIKATDGIFSDIATVRITVNDINDHAPLFDKLNYVTTIPEVIAKDSIVEQVSAIDDDVGENAQISYKIQNGSFEDFYMEGNTGAIRVARRLDYDIRNSYQLEIIATDGGTPQKTGTTLLTIQVLNINDKTPYFIPTTQKAQVMEDARVGEMFHILKAEDPDLESNFSLMFAITEPITAINKYGKEVTEDTSFKNFFKVEHTSGTVIVAKPLQRNIAAVVQLTVTVTDSSADPPQEGNGTLIVTIIDVNDFPPRFISPWTPDNPLVEVKVLEDQPIGTVVTTMEAIDEDSNIQYFAIDPPSPYFSIDNSTGVLTTEVKLDYEKNETVNITVVVYDDGIPQFSTVANVIVNVININDMDPVFNKPAYNAQIMENAPFGTSVATVNATDSDKGDFGIVSYMLVGDQSQNFHIDPQNGTIVVDNPAVLDREVFPELVLQVAAFDGAPKNFQRSTTVPVNVKLLDVNDNPPKFPQREYQSSIPENIPFDPPTDIIQIQAHDADEGEHALISYSIIDGNKEEIFAIDRVMGTLYPAKSLIGVIQEFHLVIEARDGNGTGPFHDQAMVTVIVEDVNLHKPVFIMPALPNATVEVPENAGIADYLVLTVKAHDGDAGDNGLVSYAFKVGNENVQETDVFSINSQTGELRTKVILDREFQAKYQLVLVAYDHGTPEEYETSRYLTVLLVDTDDNRPEFEMSVGGGSIYHFKVEENENEGHVIGHVKAIDKDEGKHAQIFYYILFGNEGQWFNMDKNRGTLSSNISFDREKRDTYDLHIKASNNPNYSVSKARKEHSSPDDLLGELSVAHVHVSVTDINDNPPMFEREDYYSGVSSIADINQLVIKVTASDPDLGTNGTISYSIYASYLYQDGSNHSSGSVIPSPFAVTADGKLLTATPMVEYKDDRFLVELIAKEKAPPYKEARAKVHVWVYDRDQLIRIILANPPEDVNQQQEDIALELSNVTQSLIIVDDIQYHIDSEGKVQSEWSDMFVHAVSRDSNSILPVSSVLDLIDTHYDFLKNYYGGFAIENVVPAYIGESSRGFDPALAALIALVVVLFVGSVAFLVICCCLKHWIPSSVPDLKRKEVLIKKEFVDELATTDNPLWIEHKMKTYEEQELSMQVFSEPDQTTTSSQDGLDPRLDLAHGFSYGESCSNHAYATLQRLDQPNQRLPTQSSEGETNDYASLDRSYNRTHRQYNSNGGTQLYSELEDVTTAFQGSTFQVPVNSPRTNVNLTVNDHGEPQLVTELM